MKALSIRPPWSYYIVNGQKTIETRTWTTPYRGDLLICAGMTLDYSAPGASGLISSCARGVAVAVAEFYDIKAMSVEHEKAALCPARPGLWAWYLRNVRPIKPFPVKGQLGLFNVPKPPELLEKEPTFEPEPGGYGRGLP